MRCASEHLCQYNLHVRERRPICRRPATHVIRDWCTILLEEEPSTDTYLCPSHAAAWNRLGESVHGMEMCEARRLVLA